MKKWTIILLVVVLILAICLPRGTVSNKTDTSATETSSFRNIEGKEYLVYSLDTQVIYYMFGTKEIAGYNGFGYSYFAPYISENGNFCRYINDEIVEIINTNN